MPSEPRVGRNSSTVGPSLEQADRTFVSYLGHKYSYFAGCDYFRLATDPELVKALTGAAAMYGLNVAASRKTTGNHPLYEELEVALAEFFQAPAATSISNGYSSNLVVAQAMRGVFTHVLIDAKAHGSLLDASELFQVPVMTFRHRDPVDLARRIAPFARPIVLTDGMFSHNGSTAPVAEYIKALPKNGGLLLDEAHAAGILGKNGRGTLEFEEVADDRIIRTITLSKAFGSYGGAILGSRDVRQRIVDRSRIFGGNTPVPLPFAAAAIRGIDLISRHPEWRARLMENSNRVKKRLGKLGLFDSEKPGPILPVATQDKTLREKLRLFFLARGIFPPLIRYPGGPSSEYFRFVISSMHTEEQLKQLENAFLDARKKKLL